MVKVDKQKLILAIIPAILFILSLEYKAIEGPYYFGHNSDPEYCYLFNSLNIVNFFVPFHTDHPGTPLQVLGAVVIVVKSMVTNFSISPSAIQASVLANPEAYLRAINLVLMTLLSVLLFLSGLKLFQYTNRLLPAFVLQFSLLCFLQVHVSLARISPEPFLISLVLLLNLVLIPEIFAEEREPATRGNMRRPVLAGIVLGLGIATKVIFFPLLYFVFLFDGARRRVVSLACSILSFIFFTLPAAPAYAKMYEWFKSLLLHEGYYGIGRIGLPGMGKLFSNINSLLFGEPLLIISAAFYLSAAIILKYRKSRVESSSRDKTQKLLWIGSLIILTQILVTAKHPHLRYLLPSMVAAGIINASLIYVFMKKVPGRLELAGALFIMVLLIAFGHTVVTATVSLKEDGEYAAATGKLLAEVGTMKRYYRVGFYRSSLPQFALAFGNSFSGYHYGKELSQLYPDSLFYDIWKNCFYSFEGKKIYDRDMRGFIAIGEKFIMVGSQDTLIEKKSLITELVSVNAWEGIFLLKDIRQTALIGL